MLAFHKLMMILVRMMMWLMFVVLMEEHTKMNVTWKQLELNSLIQENVPTVNTAQVFRLWFVETMEKPTLTLVGQTATEPLLFQSTLVLQIATTVLPTSTQFVEQMEEPTEIIALLIAIKLESLTKVNVETIVLTVLNQTITQFVLKAEDGTETLVYCNVTETKRLKIFGAKVHSTDYLIESNFSVSHIFFILFDTL